MNATVRSLIVVFACLMLGGCPPPAKVCPQAGRIPMLLVHGLNGEYGPDSFAVLKDYLASEFVKAGEDTDTWLFSMRMTDSQGPIEVSALDVCAAIDALLATTGATQIAIVSHSLGGLATGKCLELHPELAPFVKFHLSLSSPHQGTTAADPVMFPYPAMWELIPGSAFLVLYNALPTSVSCASLGGGSDDFVVPPDVAIVRAGCTSEVYAPYNHISWFYDPEAMEAVRLRLEGALCSNPN